VTPAYQAVWFKSSARAHSLRHLYRVEPWIAGLALLLAAPLLTFVAGAIVLLSGKAPLVRHRRVGFQGAELPMLKFRTMWQGRIPWKAPYLFEDVSGVVPVNKEAGDERVGSKFALWCRRFSIDELPQLYHVVRGEMSLVGPRPITRAELDNHYGQDAAHVLALRPGLTGLWQIMGRNRLSYAQRRRLDLWLVRYASPRLYFRILWRSVPRVIYGHDAH
jgi:exopolysaccharide production protein ExoY